MPSIVNAKMQIGNLCSYDSGESYGASSANCANSAIYVLIAR